MIDIEKLSYKTFVWPQNPHTYKEEYIRTPMYKTVDQVTYFDGMSDMKQVISGKGIFYGDNAFTQFKALAKIFEDAEAGNLEHPVWGIRYCYFTNLELTQEPKNNYVSYTFEFTRALNNGIVPK